jgi:hypothetical protein
MFKFIVPLFVCVIIGSVCHSKQIHKKSDDNSNSERQFHFHVPNSDAKSDADCLALAKNPSDFDLQFTRDEALLKEQAAAIKVLIN